MRIPLGLSRFIRWVEGTDEPLFPAREEKSSKAARKGRLRRAALRTPERARKDVLAKEKRLAKALYRAAAGFVCVTVILTLLLIVSYLPRFGSGVNPDDNEVYERYVEEGLREAGAVNTVADIILDYRAFDTLGESNVLFIAVCSVMILLRADRKKEKPGEWSLPELAVTQAPEKPDLILQSAVRLLMPIGLLYGMYVILNGHLSAGGGFSGGAVIGGCMILYSTAFGCEKLDRFFTVRSYQWVTFFSLMTYTCLKAYSFYTGANGLESGIPLGTPGAILSGGLILPLNICVGLVVACTMYAFYALFSRGGFGHGR